MAYPLFWANQWIRSLQHLIYTMPHRYISRIKTRKQASLYIFTNPFLAISTENTRFAELGALTLQQCSGNNRIKLCRKVFTQQQMKHSFVWVHSFTNTISQPSATVKSFQFCCPTLHKPSILWMACITSHAPRLSSYCYTCHPSFLARLRFYSTSVDVFFCTCPYNFLQQHNSCSYTNFPNFWCL